MKNFLAKTKASSYHSSNKAKGNEVRSYLMWVLCALCVVIFAKDFLNALTSSVTTTLYSIRHYVMESGDTIPVFIRSRSELMKQIEELKQRVAAQGGRETTLAYIMKENDELRSLLGVEVSPRIAASVIARPPYTPYDTVVLDRGSEDGIVLNAPVFQEGGNAFGYVHVVYPHASFVTLFSSPGVETTVYIFESNLFTTAYGEGGGVVRLSIPQGISIEKGAPVALPSLDGGVLGRIAEIQSIPTEPEQHAYVTFDVPLQSVRLVSVGKSAVVPVTFEEAEKNISATHEKLFKISVPDEFREISVTQTAASSSGTSTESEN